MRPIRRRCQSQLGGGTKQIRTPRSCHFQATVPGPKQMQVSWNCSAENVAWLTDTKAEPIGERVSPVGARLHWLLNLCRCPTCAAGMPAFRSSQPTPSGGKNWHPPAVTIGAPAGSASADSPAFTFRTNWLRAAMRAGQSLRVLHRPGRRGGSRPRACRLRSRSPCRSLCPWSLALPGRA